MASSEKRCLYEILGVVKDCTADEIRSAYKRLALQRHPDKLMQSGVSQAEATAQFQELVHAYEVLSDTKERAWYDSHRSQILFSDHNSSSNSVPNSFIPDLFSYFSNTVYSGYSDTGKGFFKVYSDLFNKIYLNEINFVNKLGLGLDLVREAPIMGNLDSPYAQVTAFYNYWLGFGTVMDFCWMDQYDVMAGQNRKSRRVMEEENKKLRKKARREYNDTVRGLADFVKKRDKRVIDMVLKRNAEIEKKKEEERERKRKIEREKMERVSAYQEPEWAKVEEEEVPEEVEEESDKKRNEAKELYCVVCGKKFKSEKQWKNHEQSKKHKEKVAELRESFRDEEEYIQEEEEKEPAEAEAEAERSEKFEEFDENVEERFKEGLQIGEENEDDKDEFGTASEKDDEDEFGSQDEVDVVDEERNEFHDMDDEISVLQAMLSGHKNRKKNVASKPPKVMQTEDGSDNENDEEDFMRYDNRKNSRKNKGRKERGKKNGGAATKSDDFDETKSQNEKTNGNDTSHNKESSTEAFVENRNEEAIGKDESVSQPSEETNASHSSRNEEVSTNAFVKSESKNTDNKPEDKPQDKQRGNHSTLNQPMEKKGSTRKDANAKVKNSKGKKSKGASKNSGNACDKCGEEFESRTKLHKHLSDTGHATLKSR